VPPGERAVDFAGLPAAEGIVIKQNGVEKSLLAFVFDLPRIPLIKDQLKEIASELALEFSANSSVSASSFTNFVSTACVNASSVRMLLVTLSCLQLLLLP
jgi:hypothetical protein